MQPAVETRSLTRVFHPKKKKEGKSVTALDSVDLKIERGELFGMVDKKNEKVRTLSTGQRQKMNVIRGFVTDPEIIFLDEPTLGLDVNASRVIRDFIVDWVRKKQGDKTVLLTTHYMAEADELCDRIAIIDGGKILACDTPGNLKKLVRMNRTFKLDVTFMKDKSSLGSIKGVDNFTYHDDPEKELTSLRFVLDDESAVSDIVSVVLGRGAKILSLQKTEPTLEDVFIKMVGKGFE